MPNIVILQAGLNYVKIVWEAGKLIFSWRRTVAGFEEEISFDLLVEETNCW